MCLPKPIEGVSTTDTAFLGATERGPVEPTLITSLSDYTRDFGGSAGPDQFMPDAVRGFFENGGKRLYVCRVTAGDFSPALDALKSDAFRDVAVVHAPHPGANAAAVHAALVAHCEAQRYRFAILDADPGSTAPAPGVDTRYAALYYPWLYVPGRKRVPPGGYVAGIYVRSDTERGVHKAPANEVVQGAIDLEANVSDHDRVNAIRQFPGRGIRVWGARTLSTDAEWKYVSVRRFFIFLERSIEEGTQWVVFEPNDEPLWARVQDAVRLFLRAQWKSGALQGTKEEHAFFVTCDRTTMTQEDIQNGRLIIEVGVAPLRPAEFVIFRVRHSLAQ